MKTPTIQELKKMTDSDFRVLLQQALEELDKTPQQKNYEELDLLCFIGGYGSAVYLSIREQGITTIDQLLEARKKDPAFIKRIAHQSMKRAYPTYYKKKDE